MIKNKSHPRINLMAFLFAWFQGNIMIYIDEKTKYSSIVGVHYFMLLYGVLLCTDGVLFDQEWVPSDQEWAPWNQEWVLLKNVLHDTLSPLDDRILPLAVTFVNNIPIKPFIATNIDIFAHLSSILVDGITITLTLLLKELIIGTSVKLM